MSNLDNKNKNILVENLIVFFLFIVFLVFNSLKTLSRIFTYGILKKEILTTKSNLGVDIKIKIKQVMNKFLAILIFAIIFLFYKKISSKKTKNLKLDKFKNKLRSTQTNIERIFLREEEKTFSDPNINIYIGIYDNEDNINRKSNIHRERLSKYKKSKLNGEMIYQDDEKKVYKFNNGKKVYL